MIKEKSKSPYSPFNPKTNDYARAGESPRDKRHLPKSQGLVKDLVRAPASIIGDTWRAIDSLGDFPDANKQWREEGPPVASGEPTWREKQRGLKHKMWLASWRDRAAQRDKQTQARKEAMFKVGPQDPHGGGQSFSLSEWEPGSKGLSPQAQKYLSDQKQAAPRPLASSNIPKPDNEYFVEQYRRPEEGVQR